MASHIVRVLSDPILTRSMGMKSKQMAEDYFSTEGMLQGFEQAIDYAIKHGK